MKERKLFSFNYCFKCSVDYLYKDCGPQIALWRNEAMMIHIHMYMMRCFTMFMLPARHILHRRMMHPQPIDIQ